MDNKLNDFIAIDFDVLKSKIDNKESFLFYLGGTWCKNCRAIDYMIIDVAKKNNVKVNNFDPRDGLKEPIDDFRKCNNVKQESLYREFIELLQYKNNETVVVDSDGELRDTNIPSLSVPALMAINNGEIKHIILEEYEEGEVTNQMEEYFKNELQVLINKL